MKNKSKLKKIKDNKPKNPTVPESWFYMNSKELTIDDLAAAINEPIQLWRELAIIEIEREDERSIVFEQAEPAFGDEYGDKFLSDNDVHSIFCVTIDTEHFNTAKEIMNRISDSIGGFFCGNSDDFSPRV